MPSTDRPFVFFPISNLPQIRPDNKRLPLILNLLLEISRSRSLKLGVADRRSVDLPIIVRASNYVRGQEAATELIDHLAQFIALGEAAGGRGGLAVRNQRRVGFEELEAGRAADAIDFVLIFDVLFELHWRFHTFAAKKVSVACQQVDEMAKVNEVLTRTLETGSGTLPKQD